MSLTRLGISHFRNISQADIEPSSNLNLIIGKNASGKTSVLEAIYFLGRASSFRTRHFERVIQKGQQSLTVYASQKTRNGQIVSFGLQKDTKKVQIRINEQKINKVSELAVNMPLQVIHPNSHQLLEEGPRHRRRFLDWGVFHVEQSFYPAWQRYQRALKQRNTSLRNHSGKQLVQSWDKELIESGNILDTARQKYVDELQVSLYDYTRPILGDMEISLRYKNGWNKDLSFSDALKRAINDDQDRGFTTVGPQRADIAILADGVLANERISRGQQKILVTGLLLSQAGLYNKKTENQCILLIDDVAAELDPDNREKLLNVLKEMKVQMFLTSIEKQMLAPLLGKTTPRKTFHVEHGNLTEVV